jgi:hypothetical protein
MWEDRLVRPIDVYPEHRRDPWRTAGGEQIDDRHFRTTQEFLEIATDEGITGIAGPLWPDPARLVLDAAVSSPPREGPLATELLWDQMHRFRCTGGRATP